MKNWALVFFWMGIANVAVAAMGACMGEWFVTIVCGMVGANGVMQYFVFKK